VYSWTFDDGATATGLSVTHAFATAGQHTGTVTVTDPTGESVSASSTVTVATPGGPISAGSPGVVPHHTAPTIRLVVKSRLSLAKALRGGIPAVIGCSEACVYRATLTFDARTAGRLHMGRSVPLGTRTTTLPATGGHAITIRLTRRARGALSHVRGARLVVSARATDLAGNASQPSTRTTTLRHS
jgi:hypothetical protein